MGSAPSQTLEADLDGTGSLVDITSYVDFQVGIKHSWGRTAGDPFRSEPPPGSLTFTLDNNDGRFTPGNTATYLVGLVEGVLVQWTCGTRVRRFRTGVPEVSFPSGVGGRATVTVTCLDALALLAKREMRQMVDEVAFNQRPVAYWPINESGNGATARANDISGNAEVVLEPTGGDSTLLSWGNAVGPSTDGRGALSLQSDATAFLADLDSPCLYNYRALGTSGVTQSFLLDGSTTESGYAISLWFSVRDIYGATYSTTNDYDGPYVILAVLGGISLMWRVPDRKLVVGGALTTPTVQSMSDLPAVQPGGVHHAFMWVRNISSGGGAGCHVRVWLDGTETAVNPGDTSVHGDATAPGVYLGGSAGTQTYAWAAYGLSGTLACASVYTHQQATDMLAAGVIPDFYPVGAQGPSEDAGDRFQRLGEWLGRSEIAYSVEGTPQSILVDAQTTVGKSMLQAMCTALALEERVVDCATVAGVETVRAWMSSGHRPATAALTVNVQDDGSGVPTLTFDSSGVAVQVKAQGYSRTVTWLDVTAPERWQGTSTSLEAATDDVDSLRALAQFRSLLGRVTAMAPSKVTVDAVSSKAALTTTLLGLTPMVRITVNGLPSVIGYSTVDAILVGCVEYHRQGSSKFELQLTPDLPYEGGVEGESIAGGIPAPYEFTSPASWGGAHPITGSFPVLGGLGTSTTTMILRVTGTGTTPPADVYFPTGALVDPIYVEYDDEIVEVISAAAMTYLTINYATGDYVYEMEQSLTIARAALGTVAAVHLQSGGGLIHTSASTMGVETPGYGAQRAVFRNMYDTCAF